MASVPKIVAPFSDALLHQIAMDVGKEVVAHIESMYPTMFEAVSKNAKLSVRNCAHNAVMALVRAADEGRVEQAIVRHAEQRKKIRKMRKAASTITTTSTPEELEDALDLPRGSLRARAKASGAT